MLAVLLQDKIGQELDYANDAERPMYQGQAVRRLRARGVAAVPAILEWIAKNGRKRLALFFVEFLGELRDERISNLLADLARDRGFDWRPAATQSLAAHARAGDRDLFRALLADPLWGVRVGAALGLERLSDREAAPAIRRLLDDELYEVRARAAKSLFALGDEAGLPVLVESLSLDSVWFDIDFGLLAREDAVAFLKGVAGDDFGYRPAEPQGPALARWQAWMEARDPKWRDKVPPRARAASRKVEYVFGFELRSCRLGDFFFRLDADGHLVVGRSTLETRKLTEEERRRLGRAIGRIRTLARGVPYGRGGCDFEQFHLLADRGGFEKLWIGREGRPREGDLFVDVVAEILRKHFGDAAAAEFRERADLFRAAD